MPFLTVLPEVLRISPLEIGTIPKRTGHNFQVSIFQKLYVNFSACSASLGHVEHVELVDDTG